MAGAVVSKAPITREEMITMFGDAMPIEAVALLWNSPGETTIGEIRAKLREIAAARQNRAQRPSLPQAGEHSPNRGTGEGSL